MYTCHQIIYFLFFSNSQGKEVMLAKFQFAHVLHADL